MDLEKEIKDKLVRIQEVNKRLTELQTKIGALQEEGRAIHQGGLEIKGALDMLISLKRTEDEALAKSKTACLILPEGVKPVIEAPVEETPALPAEPVSTEIPGAEAAPTVILGEPTVEVK